MTFNFNSCAVSIYLFLCTCQGYVGSWVMQNEIPAPDKVEYSVELRTYAAICILGLRK